MGAFIEPITVGLHAFHLAQGCENKNVIIIGAGTIGLLAIQCAVALGAKSVTAIDISSEKLALAKSFGAMQTFNSSEMSAPQMQSVLRELRFNQLILETAGRTANCRTGGRDCRSSCPTGAGGHVASGSCILTSATFGKILRKELTVIGSWMNYSSPCPGQEWETASRLLTERKLSLEPLIAHRGSFESFAQAVRDIARNAMPGKVLLIP